VRSVGSRALFRNGPGFGDCSELSRLCMTIVLYTLKNVRARLASRAKRTYNSKHFTCTFRLRQQV
jgi:hypothetical protein